MKRLTKTKEKGHYNDIVRTTYQDLAIIVVGIKNIEKVVRSVLNYFTNIYINCFPKTTFMFAESRSFNQLQVAETCKEIMIVLDYDTSCGSLQTNNIL